jgi:hypothetical protein
MNSLVYAVTSGTRDDFLNSTMDASAHVGNDKPSLMRSDTSLPRRATTCVAN